MIGVTDYSLLVLLRSIDLRDGVPSMRPLTDDGNEEIPIRSDWNRSTNQPPDPTFADTLLS